MIRDCDNTQLFLIRVKVLLLLVQAIDKAWKLYLKVTVISLTYSFRVVFVCENLLKVWVLDRLFHTLICALTWLQLITCQHFDIATFHNNTTAVIIVSIYEQPVCCSSPHILFTATPVLCMIMKLKPSGFLRLWSQSHRLVDGVPDGSVESECESRDETYVRGPQLRNARKPSIANTQWSLVSSDLNLAVFTSYDTCSKL